MICSNGTRNTKNCGLTRDKPCWKHQNFGFCVCRTMVYRMPHFVRCKQRKRHITLDFKSLFKKSLKLVQSLNQNELKTTVEICLFIRDANKLFSPDIFKCSSICQTKLLLSGIQSNYPDCLYYRASCLWLFRVELKKTQTHLNLFCFCVCIKRKSS